MAPDEQKLVKRREKRIELLSRTLSHCTAGAWLAGIPLVFSGLSVLTGPGTLAGFVLFVAGVYALVAGWMTSSARRQLIARAPDGPHLARSALLVIAPGAIGVGAFAGYYLWMSVWSIITSGLHGGILMLTATLSCLGLLISGRVLWLLGGMLRTKELDELFWEETQLEFDDPAVLGEAQPPAPDNGANRVPGDPSG